MGSSLGEEEDFGVKCVLFFVTVGHPESFYSWKTR